jgi:hypothetical protein
MPGFLKPNYFTSFVVEPSTATTGLGCMKVCAFFVMAWLAVQIHAGSWYEPYTVSTIAGVGPGNTDGTGSAARFWVLTGIAVDKTGNLYVSDNNSIRKVTPTGVVTTLVARFNHPSGLAIDGAGHLYVADTDNQEAKTRALPASSSIDLLHPKSAVIRFVLPGGRQRSQARFLRAAFPLW